MSTPAGEISLSDLTAQVLEMEHPIVGMEQGLRTEMHAVLDLLLLSQVDPGVGADASSVLQTLAASAPQRVCTTVFTPGDVIWKCVAFHGPSRVPALIPPAALTCAAGAAHARWAMTRA